MRLDRSDDELGVLVMLTSWDKHSRDTMTGLPTILDQSKHRTARRILRSDQLQGRRNAVRVERLPACDP